MTTGKALPSLHDDIRVAVAAQLLVNLTIRKTAVEEVWPRSEWEGQQNMEFKRKKKKKSAVTLRTNLKTAKSCLPPNNEFNGIRENAIQHQGQTHSLRKRKTTDQ